jgi:RNA polymerase sigma-70 factor (ECF subfamily)
MAEDADDLAAALLSEAGWVRRVAARMVRDGSSADDVAQDAWVLALKQRPDASMTLRGWLTEVMRRLAHTRARAEARRRARELSDETSDAPGADRLLEKAELLHRIGQMVGELDEPYRSTVLWRYFEGASAAEIARRDGVPAGTVRWRLKVALDQLRARLGREVDRDRALRALVPIGGTGGGLMVPALKLAIPALKVAAIGVVAAAGVGATVVVVQHSRAAPAVDAAPAVAAAPAVGPPPSTRASDDPSAGAEGDNLLQRAQDAYIHGEFDDAIELAKQARAQDPAKAARIMGASSCFKGDAAGATDAWHALDDHGRKFIEYVCKRNDVTLPTGDPVL